MTGNTSQRYPRTPNLPWSSSKSTDDKNLTKQGLSHLQSGLPLVSSVKMDGSNYTLTSDRSYGRSPTAPTNAWDAPMKILWNTVRPNIPVGWRICGENMFAKHVIAYKNLPDIFLVFSMWNENNVCLGWRETAEWCKLLKLSTVPILYEGNDFDEAVSVWGRRYTSQSSEGFVLRNAQRFAYTNFRTNCAKWVAAPRVTTDDTWRQRDDFERNGFMTRPADG